MIRFVTTVVFPLALVFGTIAVFNGMVDSITGAMNAQARIEIEKERTIQTSIEQAAMTDRQKIKSQEGVTNTCIGAGWNAWRCMDRGGVNGVYRGWLFREWLTLIVTFGAMALIGFHMYLHGGES